MMRRVLWVLGGLGWGAVSFLVGVYATFPTDVARHRAELEFHKATNKEMAVGIGDLSLWRLSGADLSDVDLYTVKRGRRTKDDPKPPMERTKVLHFDRLAVRAAILPTLLGKRAVAYVAEIYGGDIDGTWATSDRTLEVTYDISDVDLSKMPLASETMELNLLGTIEGSGDLVLDTEDVKSSSGSVRLSFPGIGLGKGSKVAGFELPEVVFDKAVVAGEVKEGKLEITEGTFESSVLTATLSGDITLNKKLGRSRNRLELSFTLPEDIDKLAQVAPDLKRARDSDGVYHFLVTGTVLAPNARPNRAGGRAARTPREDGPLAGAGVGPLAGDREGDAAASEEARRARREKRIQERRERLRKRREEAAARGEGQSDKDRDFPPPDLDPSDMPPGPPDDLPPGLEEPPLDEGFLPGDEEPPLDEPMPE
ncbi:MAG: type II secretion system protein GspN [Myxococcota bacterium]